jgi:cytochrome c peroxidase
MVNPSLKPLVAALITATPFCLWSIGVSALEPIEALGKNIFFDDTLSIPSNKQACASCHDPAKGWILPNSAINSSTVIAPGAKPHAMGNVKPPSNAYASFSPPFHFQNFGPFLPPWQGGNFWDGRAEGCGANPASSRRPRSGRREPSVRLSGHPVCQQQSGPTMQRISALRPIRL